MEPESYSADQESTDQLVARVVADDHVVEVGLTGELDMATVDELTDTIERLRSGGQRRILLDLSDLAFCDACGLGGVVAAHRRLQADRGELTVTGAPPIFRKLLAITGLDDELQVRGLRGGPAGPRSVG